MMVTGLRVMPNGGAAANARNYENNNENAATKNYTDAGIGLDLRHNTNGSALGGEKQSSIAASNSNSVYLQPPVRNALRGRGPLRGSTNTSNDHRKSSMGGENGVNLP